MGKNLTGVRHQLLIDPALKVSYLLLSSLLALK